MKGGIYLFINEFANRSSGNSSSVNIGVIPFGEVCRGLGCYDSIKDFMEWWEQELEKAYDCSIDALEDIAYGRCPDSTDPENKLVPALPLRKVKVC